MADNTIDLYPPESDEPEPVNHTVEVEDTEYRGQNDTPYSEDEETQLLGLLRTHWDAERVGVMPRFYLAEQIKTHSMAQGPYVAVYYNNEDPEYMGIGIPAKRTSTSLTIELRTLHRGQLFALKKEIFRILDKIRKHPMMDYDLISGYGGRRNEPVPGNFFYTIDVKLLRLYETLG